MTLKELLYRVETLNRLPDETLGRTISSVAFDSRTGNPQGLFICLGGKQTDGALFAEEAKANGAVAFVAEKELDGFSLPVVLVKSARKALAQIAANFYGNPAEKLTLVGVTGTNGKTTTTHMIAKILQADGKKAGIIGTRGSFADEKRLGGEMTTPDPIELHQTLAEMLKLGITHVVMEVSAHALALDKCCGMMFDVAVFSNLTQDHLDYFETMENYRQAKAKLFFKQQSRVGILNADDEFGRSLGMLAEIPALTYGLENPADCFAVDVQTGLAGTRYVVNVCDEIFEAKVNLAGMFNVYNSLSAITATSALGVSKKAIVKGLKDLAEVEGRFNVVPLKKGAYAVIDFAHTPDGLEKILLAVRQLCKGRVLAVFGCGGNRDKTKRPVMGEIAERLADFTVITNDNPRYEKPEDILDEIEGGMKKDTHIKMASRRDAIALALSIAAKDDAVVICGKGGEGFQEIEGKKIPYTDREEVEKFNTLKH